MLIREGTIGDFYDVEKIAKQVHELHVEFRPDIYRFVEMVIDINTYSQYISTRSITVAEKDSIIVGFMISSTREMNAPSLKRRKILFIDSIAVLEQYRREGIGTKLLEYAKDYAKSIGLQAVELQVNAKNKSAYDSYISNGFTEKSINMEFKL